MGIPARWKWRASLALPGLAVILIASSAITRAWEFWDVGSNSWTDRWKGDGERFLRGAAIADRDLFGDSFTTVKYLKQGWTPSESMWFYNVTQGSALLPYDAFMSLESAGTTELFRTNANINRFRYLPQKATLSNPDALPIGFVKTTYKGKDYLGFTCAACHTGQINYKGTGIRIDGAPAAADNDQFIGELAKSLRTTLTEDGPRKRFVAKMQERRRGRSEQEILDELKVFAQRVTVYDVEDRSSTDYGYSRLDAFGRIYNRVLEHVLNDKQLMSVMQELVEDGKWTKADMDAVLDKQRLSHVLDDDQRDQIIERATQVLPIRALLYLRNRLFNPPNAPVSYPFLWDIPQHDYVQWNGIVANAGLGGVGRDTGEAIGVFSILDWSEKRGFSPFALISGQRLTDRYISFKSSINVRNLRKIEQQLVSLQSPQWPEDILPPIDKARKARGAVVFENYCVSCHAPIVRDDPERRVVAHMSRLADIGTDPKMAENSANYTGLSGILRNQYVGTAVGDLLISDRAPVAALLTKATFSVVATTDPSRNFVIRGFQWLYNLGDAFFRNRIKPSIKEGDYDPDTTADPFASLRAYKARSLNGIWATAPYLHNGSVPTLYDLLLPKKLPGDPDAGEYRPDKFEVGSREFDPEKVGMRSAGYEGFHFNVIHVGNSNAGHDYGTRRRSLGNDRFEEALTREQRLDLLEYLKSL
jgi:mono/diheme cytochrome c family protein